MKIIIIGDGKVGHSLAENLSQNNHVTIIDKNPEALKKSDENLDVMCIKGNGVMASTLLDADIKSADMLIAATTSDELNMVCCLTGKRLGAEHTIARIRNPEYATELSMLKEELGLNMVINPEQVAAQEIARILKFPSAINVETFANGKVELIEMKVTKEMPFVGMGLEQFSKKIMNNILVGLIVRGNEVIVPSGNLVINENDILYIIGKSSSVYDFHKIMGLNKQKVKKVMILGGGIIAYYLAKYLISIGMKVKIIESDNARCIELTELLPNALIINGDGTDEELLQSENIGLMDVFVSLTGKDEENLMSALLASQNGVKKVIPKINRSNYVDIVKNVGVDSVISPKSVITKHILKYVRGTQNAHGNTIESLLMIAGNRAEIVEFICDKSSVITDICLKDLKISQNIIIAAIVRKNKIIIPHGDDSLNIDDRVIIISKDKKLSHLNEIAK